MTPHEQLYYYNLQSKKIRSQITGYKKLEMQNINLAIKVIFKNDWIRVFQKLDGTIEWY